MGAPDVPRSLNIPVGVVLVRRPGVTRWAKWAWSAKAVIPGAPPADWKVLREEGDTTEFHVAARPLELHWTEAESYRISLSMHPPSVFVVLNQGVDAPNEHGIDVHLVTASADLAQEYQDSGEQIVEPVPMSGGLEATIREFADAHFEARAFRKRRRDRARVDLVEDGRGDPRIRQVSDVYRSPAAQKPKAK